MSGLSFGGPFFSGSIEVVCGPMFSGKTEELIRRVRRAQIGRQKVQIFKPMIDNRYHNSDVVSHSSQSVEAQPVKNSLEILTRVYDSTRVVAIDEIQFFDELIIKVVSKLARRGCRVICAGLDQDSDGRPFGSIPELLAISDSVDKVQAVCTVCGAPATKSVRVNSAKKEQVLVGHSDIYEARCRTHFDYCDEEELLLESSTYTQGMEKIPQVSS
ncbi:thymidine kinase [Bacteriovoracales bacterium]|nr:thymidine kinase [Bacteriovoracales bacterium]